MRITSDKILLGLALALCVSVLAANGIFLHFSLQKRRIDESTMYLYRYLGSANMTPEYKALFDKSFNKYVNKKLYPRPILMLAFGKCQGSNTPYLSLVTHLSAEYENSAEIGIMEEHIGSNGQTVIIGQEYPVCYHEKLPAVCLLGVFTRTRGSDQPEARGFSHDYVAWENFGRFRCRRCQCASPGPKMRNWRFFSPYNLC